MEAPAGTLVRDEVPSSIVPVGTLPRDPNPPAAPGRAPSSTEAAPFSMEGISGDMSDTGEASQAVTAVATSLNPLVPIATGLVGVAGAVAGAPWREGADTAEKWMGIVAPELSVARPKSTAADTLNVIPDAIMTGIKNYGTGKKLKFVSTDSWMLEWSKTSWGDQAFQYTGSPMFAAAVDTVGELAAFAMLGKIAKELNAPRKTTIKPEIVDERLAEMVRVYDTAVKDSAGKPLRVYHGTDKAYASESNAFLSDDSLYGPGHHFTESTNIGSEYAAANRFRDSPGDLSISTEARRVVDLAYVLDGLESSPASARPEVLANIKSVKEEISRIQDELDSKRPQNVRAAYLDLHNVLDMDAPVDPRFKKIFDSTVAETSVPSGFSWEAATNESIYRYLTDYLTKPEITAKLQEAGFDGITHIGGSIMGTEAHRVWIAFDEKSVLPGFALPEEVFKLPKAEEVPQVKPAEVAPASEAPRAILAGNESGQAKILSDAANAILDTNTKIKEVIAPAKVSETAGAAAGIVREKNAKFALDSERFAEKTEKFGQTFEALSEETHLEFIDAVETGRSTGIAAVDAAFKTMRDYRESLWKKIQEMKGTDAWIENFFPHFWEDPDMAAQVFGRSPLTGPASFFKERTVPTVKEGYARGLKLKTTNPVALETLKIQEMLRYIKGQEIWAEYKDAGLRRFVKFAEKAPEGYTKINDKIARSLQYSEAEQGFILRGDWYSPTDAAKILNNYLSPGLWGRSTLYNIFRTSGNFLNQVQLSMSAFHFTFISVDSVASTFALGIQEFLRGQFKDSGKHLVASPVAPIKAFFEGSKLQRGALTADPVYAEIVQNIVEGGGRFKTDSFYKNSAIGNFWDAWGQNKFGKAGWNAVPALIQTMAKPIMEVWVPRIKLGLISENIKSQNAFWEKQGIRPTLEIRREAYGKIVDAMDDRMGLMIYDNLHWNRVLKDVSMVSTRSLGWNLGSLRAGIGGVLDVKNIKASKAGGLEISTRTAYLIVMPIVYGVLGSMYQYLKTGESPREIKDLYFPRTGRITPDGREERVSLPGYHKDVYSYAKHPGVTISHKLHPIISALDQMYENEDYYGVMIRNSDDPRVKRWADLMRYIITQFKPFSMQGAAMRKKAGATPWEQMEAGFGIMPAPKALTQSPAEALLDQISAKHREGGPITREEALHNQAKGDITKMLREDRTTGNLLGVAQDLGIQPAELAGLLRNANKPHQVIQMIKATPREAMLVWKAADPDERKSLYPIIMKKVAGNKALSAKDKLSYLKELRDGR